MDFGLLGFVLFGQKNPRCLIFADACTASDGKCWKPWKRKFF
jgi:hypothetical protein